MSARAGKVAPTRWQRRGEASLLRAAADELGITTPESAERRRKGPKRVAVYKAHKRA